jgi:hypothetical protein
MRSMRGLVWDRQRGARWEVLCEGNAELLDAYWMLTLELGRLLRNYTRAAGERVGVAARGP